MKRTCEQPPVFFLPLFPSFFFSSLLSFFAHIPGEKDLSRFIIVVFFFFFTVNVHFNGVEEVSVRLPSFFY